MAKWDYFHSGRVRKHVFWQRYHLHHLIYWFILIHTRRHRKRLPVGKQEASPWRPGMDKLSLAAFCFVKIKTCDNADFFEPASICSTWWCQLVLDGMYFHICIAAEEPQACESNVTEQSSSPSASTKTLFILTSLWCVPLCACCVSMATPSNGNAHTLLLLLLLVQEE